jgi:hypothetical protein
MAKNGDELGALERPQNELPALVGVVALAGVLALAVVVVLLTSATGDEQYLAEVDG